MGIRSWKLEPAVIAHRECNEVSPLTTILLGSELNVFCVAPIKTHFL